MSNQELIRRKQYCQIVKEITGSDQYMVVGIDNGVALQRDHADSTQVASVTVKGNNDRFTKSLIPDLSGDRFGKICCQFRSFVTNGIR